MRQQQKLTVAASFVSLVVALQPNELTPRRDFFQKVAGTTVGSLVVGSSSLLGPSEFANAEEVAAKVTPAVKLPPIGLGCWAWGDPLFWGYDPKNDKELQQVFDYAIANSDGPVLFDTAELYGFGRSEELLGEFSKTRPDKSLIASKFAPFPFRTKAESVIKACEASVRRLGGRPIDLYQIHFPGAWSNEEYWDGMAKAYDKGLIKAVGVSNYGVDATRACYSALAKRGIPLASNQIQYSLLYKYPEENGLLQACSDLGVQVLSYSPLALGLLTGKYNRENLPTAVARKTLMESTVTKPEFSNLIASMKEVADAHKDATISQVAINWLRAKGTIPIPGARNLSQVQKNLGALGWEMSPEEVRFLDLASSKISYSSPGAAPFVKQDINTGLIMYDS